MTELDIAKRRALYLLGGRDYSRKELHKKLMNNYSEETCEKVLEFVEEYGYLDEERYAISKLFLSVLWNHLFLPFGGVKILFRVFAYNFYRAFQRKKLSRRSAKR